MMFRIGERVVYPMHGIGQVDTIVTRTVADQPQRFYQILLEGKDEGDVFVQPDRGQSVDHYTWCKERLRQGDALGLAEVRRFLHDLQRVESINNPNLRQLRSYVCEQLPAEIAQALGCPKSTADAVIDKALTSKRPVNIPAPSQP
jgi:RNA polymerase-interacting CarD/CdnL/TRCF family regulator